MDNSKITNISANDQGQVFGLGENGMLYKWNTASGQWDFYAQSKAAGTAHQFRPTDPRRDSTK